MMASKQNKRENEKDTASPIELAELGPLSAFFDAIAKDPRINSTHIGVYAAILQYWSQLGRPDRVEVFSHELIGLAKLSSRDTYFKYIRELNAYGYIRYERSFNRNKRSAIYLSGEL